MYSRPTNRAKELRIPLNYGGSAFLRTPPYPTPSSDPPPKEHIGKQYDLKASKKPAPPDNAPTIDERVAAATCLDERKNCERENEAVKEAEGTQKSASSLFPSTTSISTEDILLIALALIIFQGGKDIELALILLALLFIS